LDYDSLRGEKCPNVQTVLSAISDKQNLELLLLISTLEIEDRNSFFLSKKLDLSRKQLYHKVRKLNKAGLIRRNLGSYYLTAFGIVISQSIRVIDDGLRAYSSLKALDVINISKQVTKEEITKLIEALVKDEKVKNILKKKYHLESESESKANQTGIEK
jgi:DNA-binding HxlR family transcriptional regulator